MSMSATVNLAVDGYWYLATPYSKHPGGIERAFEDASKAAGILLSRGVSVYCPIAHTHPIAIHGDLDPYSHEIFLPLDEKMMRHAYGILVVEMPTWEISFGIAHEIEWFDARSMPRLHLSWPDLAVKLP